MILPRLRYAAERADSYCEAIAASLPGLLAARGADGIGVKFKHPETSDALWSRSTKYERSLANNEEL